MGHLWEQVVLPGRVGRQLLWSPANTGPLLASHQVVTIHDAFPLDHPEWFPPGFALWYRLLLPRLAQRAARVVTVSAYSQKRLARLLRLPPGQIAVAPGGVDPARFYPLTVAQQQRFRQAWGLPPTYLLFFGPADPRKNLKGVSLAWDLVRQSHPEVELVIAGRGAVRFAPRGQVRCLGYVDDACLPALYSAAAALLIPSLDEGFGLPALEAMACGLPVLAASVGALPEVAGEAALWVDPSRPEDIADGVDALLSSPPLHRALIHKGLDRARQFTWESTAALLGQVFRAASAEG